MGTGDAADAGDATTDAAEADDSAELRAGLVARLRAAGRVHDERVADAFATVPREVFLAGHARRLGLPAVYEDEAVVTREAEDGTPTSSSSQPSIMAVMLEMLALGPGARVLEIGAGTGYNAALLAHMVGASGTVTSVELDPDAAADARRALRVAGSPVAVVVGDGHGGWPAAAPFDALVATASVDAIPLAWHEQLVPGGVLVVPLQLIRGMFLPQAVVALRRVRQGFDPVASSPGAFMQLRSDVAAAARGESVTACEEVGDEPVERIRITGPALSALDGPARRRLLVTSLGFTRSEAFPVHWPAAWDLLTYSAMALPEERLLAVERPPASPALGVLDAADGSLALLAAAKEGLRLESFGRTGAENALRSAADRWNLAGRPGVASARVTVRYGVARPHSWRSTRRGDQWIGLDWGT